MASVLEFGTTGKLRHSDLVMYGPPDGKLVAAVHRRGDRGRHDRRAPGAAGRAPGIAGRVPPPPPRRHRAGPQQPRGPPTTAPNPYVGYDMPIPPLPFLRRPAAGRDRPAGAVSCGSTTAPGLSSCCAGGGRIEEGDLVLSWTPGQSSALDEALIARSFDVGNVVARAGARRRALEDIPYTVDFAFAFPGLLSQLGHRHRLGPGRAPAQAGSGRESRNRANTPV